MKASISICIRNKLISLFVILSASAHVAVRVLGKIVLIHKIVASVVGRVDVNHFHLAQIRFPQELQHIQIVALNIQVLAVPAAGRAILAHTVRLDGAQRCRNGRVRRQHRLLLVRPCKLIALLAAFDDRRGNLLHQNILVNGADDFAILVHGLRHRVREQRRQLLIILIRQIGGVHGQFIHTTSSFLLLLVFPSFYYVLFPC